jgi:hypothetical protein
VSAPTNVADLALYTSGKITYAEYLRRYAAQDAAQKDADTAAALQQFATSQPTQYAKDVVASELALTAEAARRRQEEVTRARLEEQKTLAEQARVQELNRQAVAQRTPAAYAALQTAQTNIGLTQAGRIQQEAQLAKSLEADVAWRELPATQQGYTIAGQMAAQRAQALVAAGGQIVSALPAYQISPIVYGQPVPDYTAGYIPAGWADYFTTPPQGGITPTPVTYPPVPEPSGPYIGPSPPGWSPGDTGCGDGSLPGGAGGGGGGACWPDGTPIPTTTTPSSGGEGAAAGGTTPAGTTTPTSSAGAGSLVAGALEFLTKESPLGIPWWGVIAGGAVILVVIRRRRR